MSVFKDMGKLSFDYLPDRLVHREKQMQRIFSLFRPVAEANASQNALFIGSVGTGKTHLSRRFCLDFVKFAQGRGKVVDHVLVNCRQRMSEDAVLLSVLKHFDERFPDRGFSIPEKLQSLRKHLEKRKSHLVVVLDEADILVRRSKNDLLYAFTRFDEEHGGLRGSVSTILISQQRNIMDYLDPATRSTFKRTNVVQFDRYARDELRDILGIRVDLAFFPGTVREEAVDLIADIASGYGDARYAIEVLERAGMLADEERADEVAPEHVRGARATTHAYVGEDKLKALDRPKQLVLLAIARRMKDRAYITTGGAEETYATVCEEFEEEPRGHTQFWKYLQDLDALGLIETSKSREGVAGRTTVISMTEVPAGIVQERLERELGG
jgi:cell division control protein 6